MKVSTVINRGKDVAKTAKDILKSAFVACPACRSRRVAWIAEQCFCSNCDWDSINAYCDAGFGDADLEKSSLDEDGGEPWEQAVAAFRLA